MPESLVVTLDVAQENEVLKARSKHISNTATQNHFLYQAPILLTLPDSAQTVMAGLVPAISSSTGAETDGRTARS